MLRSRIKEHISCITQEELLSLFGKKVSLQSIECSIFLQSQDEEKRKLATGILEILTGQNPFTSKCDPILEDPHYLKLSPNEKKEAENARGRLSSQKIMSFSKNIKSPRKDMISRGFKRNEFGLKLNASLRKISLYSFLEKLREFYLPETISKKLVDYNSLGKNELEKYFTGTEAKNKKFDKKTKMESLATTFMLKSSDLLKFPDLELHFQHLNSLISLDEKHSIKSEEISKNKSLALIVTPHLKITNPIKKGIEDSEEHCNMKIFNYILSQIFNPYSERKISS